MKKLLLPALLGFLFSACTSDEPSSRQKAEINLSRSEIQLNDNFNSFGLEFMSWLSERSADSDDPNVAVSPVSMAIALSMTANAGDGDLQQSICSLLGCEDLDGLNALSKKLMDYLPEDGDKSQLYLANAMWHAEYLSPQGAFSQRMSENYLAEISPLNFKSPEAAGVINRWCADKTRGLIDNVTTPDLLQFCQVFFANALYFKSDWTMPFKEELTEKATFHGIRSDELVDMMHAKGREIDYYAGDGCQAVTLPYHGGYEMIAIVPDAEHEAADLTQFMSPEVISRITSQSLTYLVNLSMPRFSASQKMNCDEILKDMGLDLSHVVLTELSDDNALELLLKVNHFVEFKTDEKGSVAAAVTTVAGDTSNLGFHGYATVSLDRPFVYLIRNVKTGSIILAGQFVQP